ncbi:hypothetical protein ACQ4P5_02610 [Ralstonia sp. L16]|uniref:hypothetical protein n=1 Tax=Ralstonia sp. L16 TaxID=3423950 RepID=UPI003F78C1EC
MESPNFIIDGHLRLPGLVRMPPPFGPTLDNVQASAATQVSAPFDPAANTWGTLVLRTTGSGVDA